MAGTVLMAAVLAAASGPRWLASACIAAGVGVAILGLSFGLYWLMVQLGRFSRQARTAAIVVEIVFAAPGWIMATVANSATNADPNQGPFADGMLGLMALLGDALAIGCFVVIGCLIIPGGIRRAFAPRIVDSASKPPPIE